MEKQELKINESKLNNNLEITSTPISDNNNILSTEKDKDKDNNYAIKVKNYLDITQQNEEYKAILKNNPEKLFSFLNEEIFSLWQSLIINFEPTIIESDVEIIAIEPNREDQELIRVDAKRTRFLENNLVPAFQKILEMVLTYYCNAKQIKYKQGLNEIFGPFILIQYKLKRLKIKNIFNFGEAFIDRFLPNYYYEKELYSLRSSISLFTLLLKYHEPSVFNFLDNLEIPHELYTTNWLATLRLGKFNLDILYYYIDYLVKENDPLFIHFILAAMIIHNRELLINCDSNLLTKFISGLTITSKEELDTIIKISLDLRKNTPYSFRILANKIGFLKTNNKNISYTFEKYKPESIHAIPIYPIEILHRNYKSEIICPDPECENNLKNNIMKIDWSKNNIYNPIHKNKNHICEKCKMNINKNLNYILLDLRIFPPSYFKDEDDFFKLGFISGMMALDKEDLESNDIDKILSSNLLETRGKNHIVLMTSKTDYFNEFEEKFYSDNTSSIERKKMMFGIIEMQKNEKELNFSDVKNLNLEEIYKLKEYDNLRKVMNSMKNKNFPYVSYLEGGFEALHDECLNYKIELVGHDNNKCKLCNNNKNSKFITINKIRKYSNKEISNSLWKSQKIIKVNQFDEIFNNKNSLVLFCILHKFKTKIFHNKNNEVFIVILFDKELIEIYKNEKNNENYLYDSKDLNNNKNPNYYNLGIKINKDDNNIELKLIEEIKFSDLIKVSPNHDYKTKITMEIKSKEKKEKSFIIELEFYTKDDFKLFMNALKDLKSQIINKNNL